MAYRSQLVVIFALFLVKATCAIGTTAEARSVWSNSSDLSSSDGDPMLCDMSTAWEDGRSLSIFFNENRYFGFMIGNERWSLPQGIESHVTFSFGRERENTFAVEAVSEHYVVGNWEQSDADVFIERFTQLWNMELLFPQGGRWRVNLSGSKAAAITWFECVMEVYRRTGGTSGGNPFGSGAGENPF